MGHIAKGTGYWVPSVTVRVGVRGAETAALLLDASGRVRGDADLVFHGQPEHPSGAVRLDPSGIALDLNGVEPAVERIVVAGSTGNGASFEEIPALEAVAPDGVAVATYTVTEGAAVSAVALGEFFRESGGWKFDGIGEGYGSGLAGLVSAYGVEVADAASAPAVAGPIPLTGVVKVPGQAPPAEGEYVPGLFPPPERPYRLVEGWEFGEVFEPFTIAGHGDDVITVDAPVPPGPVLVELAHEGEGYVSFYPLDEHNKKGDYLFASPLPDFRGSKISHAPEGRPLRFRITATNRWILRVKPVAAARRLEGTLRGYGPEVLLHTGKGVDLRVDFKGGPERDGGHTHLFSYEVEGRRRLPSDLDILLNDSGALRRTVPVAEGPVALFYYAAGPWTLTLKELGL
ncbi:TerD family protein [Streptomyces sp. NPDC002992]|uniref:TerD family protein n=1 Tax=Streptomyces sp. NPDC002992 TaxID=3154273 RepID=UPI0033A034B0